MKHQRPKRSSCRRCSVLFMALVATFGLSCSQPNRFEEEITAFEIQDQEYGYHKDFILFTGSSSIRLWKTLETDMEGLKVLNRGFGGATLRELNMHWSRIAGDHKPSVVVLYCGENDIAEGASIEETVGYFDSIIEKCQNTFPGIPFIYIAMKPSPNRMEFWEDYQKADSMIRKKIEMIKAVSFVDLGPTMLNDVGKLKPEIFEADSLHMNALGYEGWTEKLRPMIESKMN